MAEPTSEKLVGTIGIRVSETTDRELDALVEKLDTVNSAADSLLKKTITLDVKTDGIENKLNAVAGAMNKELREQLTGGFRVALDEMRSALKSGDFSINASFDVAEFSAQFSQAVTSAAHSFSTSVASDLQAAVSQIRQSAATTTVASTVSTGAGAASNQGDANRSGLALIYQQITAAVREEYRIMTQMLSLEGNAYDTASDRLELVREQVEAYEQMIRQAAEAGEMDERRAANLQNLRDSLESRYDISASQASQQSMQQNVNELLNLYTRLLDVTQRIQLSGDETNAGLVMQRQQLLEAYNAQERICESYKNTTSGAQLWNEYLEQITKLTAQYAENTQTQQLVQEQEKLNALRLEEVKLAYEAHGSASAELELVSQKAAAQQAVVDRLAASQSQNEAYLAAQRNGIAQVTRELERQAQLTAKLQDTESRKSEQALYSFNMSELQRAYKEILSSSTKLWSVQEQMKGASSAELPFLQQIEASLQRRISLSQNVFTRLQDMPKAQQLQTQLADELNTKQAEYNLKLLQSREHADGLARSLEYMVGNLLANAVRNFARGIINAFKEAVSYVEEYNSMLTEISIVTGRTQDQVETLGESYRDLAREMQVSSKDIAEAAVGYYRQGLSDAQVIERLTKTIQFSKTAHLEFAQAAEYLTATVNSMDITIERAADVFNYLGDATATGADEIAMAFSKVGGAAKSADLEFEKVSSWIATISARTREAAEVIGNSLNSILARYRNIKASGFTENDDGTTTVTNDVIKALKAADIDAIDAMTGQLRNYGDILDELAPKWKTLDSNTQAYIGTVMAGTRMQSRFFNLLENYEASLELYNEALEATGTTSAKYEKWSQSVEAAHENMNASLEALYANLMNSDAIKVYYNLMASLADVLGLAIGKLDLWKLSFGLVAAAVVAAMSMMRVSFRDLNMETVKMMGLRIMEWFSSIVSSSNRASVAVRGLGAAFKACLAFLVVSIIVSVVQALISAGDASERAAKQIERMNNALSDISDRHTKLTALTNELEALQEKAVLSQTDFERLVEIKAELAALSPELAARYEAEGQSMVTLTGLVQDAADAYRGLQEEERKAKAGARTAYYDETNKLFADWGTWGRTDYERARDTLAEIQAIYDSSVQYYEDYIRQLESYDPVTRAEIMASDYHQSYVADMEQAIAENRQQLSAAQDAFDAELLSINKTYQEGAVAHMKAALDGLEEADEERRELAYRALDSAQAYAKKDDAHTEAMIAAYLSHQDSANPLAFSEFSSSAQRYFDLLQNGAGSYSELQEAADGYAEAAIKAFGIDVSGSTQKVVDNLLKQRDTIVGTLNNNQQSDWMKLLQDAEVYDNVAALTMISEGLQRTQHDADLSGTAISELYEILTDGTPSDTVEQLVDWLEALRETTADITLEAYTMSAALTKAIADADKAMAKRPVERLSNEGGYRQLTELAQTGQITDLNEDMLLELLNLYPELAALIDETTGLLRNDFDALYPTIEKARLAYADYLKTLLDTVTQAKTELAQGIFDPTAYADLISQMRDEGFDLLSVLGGGDVEEAQRMLTAFFNLYNAQLDDAAGHIGIVADSWAEAHRLATEATIAEEQNFLQQLESLRSGGSVLDWNNAELANAFADAYPEIAACLDETGRFAGSLDDLDRAIGMVHFAAFEDAGEKISGLQSALKALADGSAYDALNELPEEYQAQILPLLNDRLALEQWLTDELGRQQDAQRAAWVAMAGGAQGYEEYIRSAVDTTKDLTKAIEAAKAALLDKSFSRMEREGAYAQIRELYDTGRIEGFDMEMFERLLELYPELVNMIDHETGTLTADLSELVPILNRATLTYAASLRDILEDINSAKDDMSKGIFDASAYEELIDVMDEYGFDLLSMLGGEEGFEDALEMMDEFFETYQDHLEETGSKLGIVAENWETVQAKAEKARQAAEEGYSAQLSQLIETGTLGMDNNSLTQGFLNAYPAIAACIDATGKFTGNVGDLRKELGKLSFKKFTSATSDIEDLQDALARIRKGKSAIDVISGLAESYQAELIPALNNRMALEELITQAIGDQAIEQQYALWQMQGNTGSFINYCANAYPELYNALAQVYGSDVQNFQTFSQAKAEIDAAVRQAIGNSWDGVYTSGIAQMDKAAASLAAAGETATAAKYRAIANAMRALNNVRVSTGGGVKIPSVSSGGGGGGSSSSAREQTDADKLLERMGDTDDYVDAQRTILQLQQAYHEAKNESEAVLHYMQQEYELVKTLPQQYRDNMAAIKAMLDAKKAELATTSASSDQYESLASDIRNLESAYQDYQQQLIQAETDLESLTQAMEEHRNAARNTLIEIEDLVNQAIEDRNAREKDALDARIDMEEEIIAALQARYDAEKEMQQDALNERKAALQAEKQALVDALNERKQLKEEQSKAEQLALMEANYAVISRDSTRSREAAELLKDIKKLRDEIAEDLLAKQIEEQQKMIDEQIKSVEDELAALDEAYSDHTAPAELASEIEQLLSMTDEEIIAWLMEHNESFATSTAAMQEAMIAGWQETLDTMHGIQRTNWDEVQQIIEGGQDAILEFLRNNLDDYRQASQAQAEAYEEEWVKVLERLQAQMQAFRDTATLDPGEILQSTYIPPSTASSSSSGSSGSSSSSTKKSSSSSSSSSSGSSSSSSSSSGASLSDLLKSAAVAAAGGLVAGAVGAGVSSGVGGALAAAAAAAASAVSGAVKSASSIAGAISSLFSTTSSKSSSSTTNNSVTVNVNASTVKSTANNIKETLKKNGISMALQ